MFSSIILMTASMFVFLFKMTSMFWDTRSAMKNVNILNNYCLIKSVISSFTTDSGRIYLPGSVRMLFKSSACWEPSNRFDMHCCERFKKCFSVFRVLCMKNKLFHTQLSQVFSSLQLLSNRTIGHHNKGIRLI